MTEEEVKTVELQNDEAQEEEEISLVGLTINGIPSEKLSAMGQSTLRKIITKKQELDQLAQQVEELSARYNETQTVMNTLVDLLKEETTLLNATTSE